MSTQLPQPMGEGELRKAATQQIDLEINQAVSPIQSQITTTEANRDRALGQIGGMFDALQPTVQQAAEAVTSSYNQAISQQNAIFSSAQSMLQNLRSRQASDAQELAQQIGGPVAMDQFTRPYDAAANDLTYLGAGQQLHTLAYAQAGEQQAQQFAGQIFPLVRTEQMTATRNQFEDQIREYQDQITALKSQKGAQVNKRYNELRTQELEYGLQRAQYQLQKLDAQRNYNLEVKKAKVQQAQANREYQLNSKQLKLEQTKAWRDWKVALRTAGQEDKKIKLADKQYDLAVAQTFGKDKAGRKTFEATVQDDTMKQFWASHGLDERRLKAELAEAAANRKLEEKKLATDEANNWYTLMDAATNPQPGKTFTKTVQHEIKRAEALEYDALGEPTGAFKEGVYTKEVNGKTIFYINEEVTDTIRPMPTITDPNQLVDYLVTAMDSDHFTRTRAAELVRQRFPDLRATGWTYGKKYVPSWEKVRRPQGQKAPLEGTFPDWIADLKSGEISPQALNP